MTSNTTEQHDPASDNPLAEPTTAPVTGDIEPIGPVPSPEPSDTAASAGAVSEPPASLPGGVLAARRAELRLTLEAVSERLKLAPRQIVALETNDFASLPGMASVRGFIRSYAKLLEMDPVPLLAMMSAEVNPATAPIVLRRPLPTRGFPGRRYAPPGGHRRGARRLSGLAILALVFISALAYAAYRHDLVRSDRLTVPEIGAWLPTWPAAEVTETAEDNRIDSAAGTATVVAGQNDIDPSRLLELSLREDAWVEISTMNGNKKVSRLMKAGTTERFDVSEPVVLVVGNASGVDATLRGQPLNLRAVARDNVSKLSLK